MYSITQLISASVASKECEGILSDCCRRRLLGASLDQLISLLLIITLCACTRGKVIGLVIVGHRNCQAGCLGT